MKNKKNTVSIRLEIDKDIHKKIKLIQAKMLLNGEEIGLNPLCIDLLTKSVENEVQRLQINVK